MGGVEGKVWAAVSVVSDSVELRLASSRSLAASSAVFIGTSSSLRLVLPEASAPDLACFCQLVFEEHAELWVTYTVDSLI